MLARISGAPVLFVGLAAEPCIRLKSWDRAMIPLPFTRGAIVWGGGVSLEREAAAEALALQWSATLSDLTRRAEALLA